MMICCRQITVADGKATREVTDRRRTDRIDASTDLGAVLYNTGLVGCVV